MYYDSPEDERAYHALNQYMFGEDIIAVTVFDALMEVENRYVLLPHRLDPLAGGKIDGSAFYHVIVVAPRSLVAPRTAVTADQTVVYRHVRKSGFRGFALAFRIRSDDRSARPDGGQL